ncbi:helix-turn-helix transcriptional regulator [Anaerosalibacter bizertensis]|uniref:Helix-turn-helix transcriptional regulator n=1 Tax=Anaerosalibacter bizertensis TaxID=932217 RepID=A0A844FIL3_9FIRM|nr:helix-turn-helix transcriptional regulator [Anaerosalibacter bizertensis]MSS43768.1 helix-turn-helix transcriptional regulator [Anaerosalibacter bizertensis]
MLEVKLRMQMAKHKIDTVAELMELSGLSRNAINRLYKENEVEKVELRTLLKLCDTFNCNLSDLIEYIPEGKE